MIFNGLMWRQWIIALLWLIFIKLLHFLIMHKNTWPISWMLWYQWTGIIVCILCVQECGSHPDLKITSKYSTFQREPRRKGLAQICIKEPKLKNKRQEQEGNIFSCVASVSIGRPLLGCLSTFTAFATGNLNEQCVLQHLPEENMGRKNTDLRFYLVCE